MGTITSKNNILYWTIAKGVTTSTTIVKSDGWAMYNEILMDFKQDLLITSPPSKSLTIGNGLAISGNNLIISLTYLETTVLTSSRLYADIKLKTGSTVLPPIKFIITIVETVTEVE